MKGCCGRCSMDSGRCKAPGAAQSPNLTCYDVGALADGDAPAVDGEPDGVACRLGVRLGVGTMPGTPGAGARVVACCRGAGAWWMVEPDEGLTSSQVIRAARKTAVRTQVDVRTCRISRSPTALPPRGSAA